MSADSLALKMETKKCGKERVMSKMVPVTLWVGWKLATYSSYNIDQFCTSAGDGYNAFIDIAEKELGVEPV